MHNNVFAQEWNWTFLQCYNKLFELKFCFSGCTALKSNLFLFKRGRKAAILSMLIDHFFNLWRVNVWHMNVCENERGCVRGCQDGPQSCMSN